MMRSRLYTRVIFKRAFGCTVASKNALFQAIERNDVTKVYSVIASDKHLCVAYDDLTGETPIHAAAQRGNVSVLQLLVKAASELAATSVVNALNNLGETALHTAAQANHKSAVEYLMQNGADPAIKNYEQMCAADLTADVEIDSMLRAQPAEHLHAPNGQ